MENKMAVCKGDGIPSEGKSMHKGRRGGQIRNFKGWDERVPADTGGLENTWKTWERERVRKEDDSEVCSSRDWKTNDAIIRHRDVRKKS